MPVSHPVNHSEGVFSRRGSGLLLHISSLPSPFGIGDLGPEAYRFAEFLAWSKQSCWQILPLNPVDAAFDSSPYHSLSAFAFNRLFISPEIMVRDGFLEKTDLENPPEFEKGRVDYPGVSAFKDKLLNQAFSRFLDEKHNAEFTGFCAQHAEWLEDFALFSALKAKFSGEPWKEWPPDIKDRSRLERLRLDDELIGKMEKIKFVQFLFHKQWQSFKTHCSRLGIRLIGDIPIYVVHDSVDVWTHRELFKLDREGKPLALAGVPPDYFSKTGQLWGNPVYRWEALRKSGYDWWINRMTHNLILFDLVRIDHFRGFVGYWEVPASEKTAVNGKWVNAPAEDFFRRLKQKIDPLPVIAEDLGTITPDVHEVMRKFGFPGMKVLLFAFGDDDPDHPYLPHTYEANCVVYSGTHDNNTVRGWYCHEANPDGKRRFSDYVGRTVSEETVHWDFIRLALMSPADTAVFPVQDILGLGAEARMNRPATSSGNWRWRLLPGHLTLSLAKKLAELTADSGR